MIEYVNSLLLLMMLGSACYVYYKMKKFFYLIGGPRATETIQVYWKNFTSGLSFTVSILGQHFWSAFATSSSRHQGGSYNSKTSLSA